MGISKYVMAVLGIGNLVLGVLLYFAYGNLNKCRTDRATTVDQNKGLVEKTTTLQTKLRDANLANRNLVDGHNREVQAYLNANRVLEEANAGTIRALQGTAGYWAGAIRASKPIPYSNVCDDRLTNIQTAIKDYQQEVKNAQ